MNPNKSSNTIIGIIDPNHEYVWREDDISKTYDSTRWEYVFCEDKFPNAAFTINGTEFNKEFVLGKNLYRRKSK
jgi:hypothetical protein